MDYEEFRANTVVSIVSAILSTGGPVLETLIESVAYKPIVDHAFRMADYIIEKLKDESTKD